MGSLSLGENVNVYNLTPAEGEKFRDTILFIVPESDGSGLIPCKMKYI